MSDEVGSQPIGQSYVKTSCPACDQRIEVPEELIGQSVICPSCNQGFVVPKSGRFLKLTQPKWYIGLIILLVGIALSFVGGFLFRFNVPYIFLLSALSPLLFVYGLVYLIVCLIARKKAGMTIRIWKFQTNLTSLISTICVSILLLWFGSSFLKETRNSDWDSGEYIHASDERNAPIFEAVERGIKEKLVSPSSAKFETMAKFIRDEKQDDLAFVKIEVDSQNKYGAMVRSKWQVDLRRHTVGKETWWSAKKVKMIETSEK